MKYSYMSILFLFVLAMIIFPSFASMVGTVISTIFQFIALMAIVNIAAQVLRRIIAVLFKDNGDDGYIYTYSV